MRQYKSIYLPISQVLRILPAQSESFQGRWRVDGVDIDGVQTTNQQLLAR